MLRLILTSAILLVLTSCSGGGGGSSNPTVSIPTPPVEPLIESVDQYPSLGAQRTTTSSNYDVQMEVLSGVQKSSSSTSGGYEITLTIN